MTNAYPLTPATFATLLRRFDDEGLAAFVGELRLKEGWDVDVEGDTVTITRGEPRDERRRVRAVADTRTRLDRLLKRDVTVPDLEDVDVLVVGAHDLDGVRDVAEDAGVSVIDAEELYYQLLYAVDRTTCRAMCRRHLGIAIEPLPPAKRSASRYRLRVERLLEQVKDDRRRIAGATAVIVLVIAIATIGVIGTGAGPSLQPGGGITPVADLNEITPVGMGAESAGPSWETTTAVSTPDPDILLGNLGGATFRNGSAYYPSPRIAVQQFALHVRASHRSSRFATVAWRAFDEQHRPNYNTFLGKIHAGNYRRLSDFDQLQFGRVEGLPPLQSNETVRRGYLSVFRDGYRTVFGYVAVCREQNQPDDDTCWQLQDVVLLSDPTRSTPMDWASTTDHSDTPTMTQTPRSEQESSTPSSNGTPTP